MQDALNNLGTALDRCMRRSVFQSTFMLTSFGTASVVLRGMDDIAFYRPWL
jgi:hypothetical protein